MKTEAIIIGGVLLTAAAIRIIITDLIVPLVALLLALAGWRPAPSAAAAPAPAVELPRPLALAPSNLIEITPEMLQPVALVTPRAVLQPCTVRHLRSLARMAGVPRDIYYSARKQQLIDAILAATPNRGGASRASG
jgi:hypothetical protein